MGCTQATSVRADIALNKNHNDLSIKNNTNKNDNTNAIQPVVTNSYISLSNRDIYRLKASWKAIKRSLEETGVLMFQKLFEKNQEFINLFEKFKNLPRDKLYTSTVFLDHVNSVMEEIDKAVTDLDNGELSQKCIKKIGAEHKTRGVQASYFNELKEPFIAAIESVLGDRFTDNMRPIYVTFIDYLIKTLIEGLNG